MSTKNVLTYLGQQGDQKQPSRGVLKKNCSENMQQHPCRSVISIKIALRYAANLQENTHAEV